MTQFGVLPRATGSKFFPPTMPIARAAIPRPVGLPLPQRWKSALRRVPAIEAALEGLEPRTPTMQEILQDAADDYGVPPSLILGKCRKRVATLPRQEAMWRCLHETKATQQEVAIFFNRDHSSVAYGVAAHQSRLDALKEAEAADV